jgi:hypothetical protein
MAKISILNLFFTFINFLGFVFFIYAYLFRFPLEILVFYEDLANFTDFLTLSISIL